MRIELEEPFKSKWKRAYLRENDADGRKRIDLVNSNSDRTTISYARYLMSVKLGRELAEGYEVDHINTDRTNDNIDNLQVLSKEEHKTKTVKEKPKRKFVLLVCPNCEKEFVKFLNQMSCEKPKCSRRCNAQYSRKNGKWLGKSIERRE
jgi:hypothetical protein